LNVRSRRDRRRHRPRPLASLGTTAFTSPVCGVSEPWSASPCCFRFGCSEKRKHPEVLSRALRHLASLAGKILQHHEPGPSSSPSSPPASGWPPRCCPGCTREIEVHYGSAELHLVAARVQLRLVSPRGHSVERLQRRKQLHVREWRGIAAVMGRPPPPCASEVSDFVLFFFFFFFFFEGCCRMMSLILRVASVPASRVSSVGSRGQDPEIA